MKKKKAPKNLTPKGLKDEIKKQLLARNSITGILSICVDQSGGISIFGQTRNARLDDILQACEGPIINMIQLVMHLEKKGLL